MKPLSLQIELAQTKDREKLIQNYLHYLEHVDQFEHDVLPTRSNAEWFVDHVFLPAAGRGEPILLARQDESVVGNLFWAIPECALEVRYCQAIGYGTYIAPNCRGEGIGKRLRQEGIRLLKEKGVKILVGTVLFENQASIHASDRFGFKPYARMDRYEIK